MAEMAEMDCAGFEPVTVTAWQEGRSASARQRVLVAAIGWVRPRERTLELLIPSLDNRHPFHGAQRFAG
jgi:hypothetical protein